MAFGLWKKVVVGSVVAALTLAGCSANEEEEEQEVQTAVVVSAPVEPDRHPLTGVEMDPSEVTGPAIMAKIDHENRPYMNLDRADIVWQQLIPENGTRFLAIWHSDIPDEVAYVRSFRAHDYHMAAPFGGVLASTGLFSGFIPILNSLEEAGVKNVVWDNRGPEDRDLWRVANKSYAAASSVVFSAAEAHERFGDLAPPQQYFQYKTSVAEATASSAGEPITTVSVYYSRSTTNNYTTSKWSWNAENRVFDKIWVNGDPITVESGEPLVATNLVILDVPHKNVKGQPTGEFDTASGVAWVATNGKIVEVQWAPGNTATDPLVLTTVTGDPVYLAPGTTWILPFPGEGSTARTKGWGGSGEIAFE